MMPDRKPPHEQLTVKDNGLTSTQEVLYQQEFKKADQATQKNNSRKKWKINHSIEPSCAKGAQGGFFYFIIERNNFI